MPFTHLLTRPQPALLAAVAKHPFITFLCSFAPLLLATRARATLPANILLALLFTFTVGIWISAGTLLVFSGLLIFDTWRLRNVYGPDQYVLAAVQIYLDLLNMFLAILHLLGRRRN